MTVDPQAAHRMIREYLVQQGSYWLEIVRNLEPIISDRVAETGDKWLPVRLYLDAIEAIGVNLPRSYEKAVRYLQKEFGIQDVLIMMPRWEEGNAEPIALGTQELTDPHQFDLAEALAELRSLLPEPPKEAHADDHA